MGRTKKQAFEPLIELLKNNHIEYDRNQTIDRITYNHNKSKQPWLGVLQKFDAKITPLGVSYLQQLANEKLTQSVIDTNTSVKETNKYVKNSIPIQVGLSFLTVLIVGLTGYISWLTYQSGRVSEAQEKRIESLEKNIQQLKELQSRDTTLRMNNDIKKK